MNKSSLFFLLLIFCLQISLGQATNVDDAWLFNRQGLFKASRGDYTGAIRDFERACRLNPFDDNALANLACARNNLGVILANKKNYAEAIRHFKAAKAQKPEDISIRLNLLSTLVTIKDTAAIEREAAEIIALRPNDVETVFKVAAAFQNSENALAAQSILEALADRVPDNGEVHATLGRLLYYNGDLSEAEYHLNRACQLDPSGSRKALALLEQIRREQQVNRHSRSFSSIHFTLICHESFSEEWGESLLELLEESYDQIGKKLNFYPSQRSQVLVFQTKDFHNVHDLPEWAGGVYDGKIRLPVPGSSISPDFLRGAIRHEYTHHVVFLITRGKCPIWLNEGLAQVFEFDSEADELVEDFKPEIEMLQNFAVGIRTAQNPSQVAAIYSNAYKATLKIIAEIGWTSIAEILEKIGQGFSFEEAAQDILGYTPLNL